ncbi:MAG: hypothetical protein HUJ63_09400 [Enterococcus sp.]|nr:hypothetical protein [Enterococcus sp.]
MSKFYRCDMCHEEIDEEEYGKNHYCLNCFSLAAVHGDELNFDLCKHCYQEIIGYINNASLRSEQEPSYITRLRNQI